MNDTSVSVIIPENKIEFQDRSPSTFPERTCVYKGTGGNDGDIYLIEREEELVDTIPIPVVLRKMSPTEALLILSQAHHEDEIGQNPLWASGTTPENTEEALSLFMAEFGRDSLETAKTLIDEYPAVALKTLLSLASSQGVVNRESSEEEPGKIIHENRTPDDPIAQMLSRQQGWEWPYYGAVDATLLFIQLGGSYGRRYGEEFLDREYTDRGGNTRTLRYSFSSALTWVEKRRERSPHGFVEYFKEHPQGIENKVWRDSLEAYHHSDGRIAQNTYGIASFSVQVDAYKALRAAGFIFPEKKDEYHEEAEKLKEKILSTFWVEKGGFFALGMERKKDGSAETLKIKTSDMGHVLESSILSGDNPEIIKKRESVIQTLFSSEMLASSGVRTLSSKDIRFNAGAYHNGSVWPRETIKIARGLEYHGYNRLARELHKRNVRIWEELGVFPEYVRGDESEAPHINTRIVKVRLKLPDKDYYYNLEQPGQLIQAWSVASILQSIRQLEKYESGVLCESQENTRKNKFETELLLSIGGR